jgi:hypothetical protein
MWRETQNPLISSQILCPFAEQSSLGGSTVFCTQIKKRILARSLIHQQLVHKVSPRDLKIVSLIANKILGWKYKIHAVQCHLKLRANC